MQSVWALQQEFHAVPNITHTLESMVEKNLSIWAMFKSYLKRLDVWSGNLCQRKDMLSATSHMMTVHVTRLLQTSGVGRQKCQVALNKKTLHFILIMELDNFKFIPENKFGHKRINSKK